MSFAGGRKLKIRNLAASDLNRYNFLTVLLCIFLFIAVTWAVSFVLPIDSDWADVYRPAVFALLSGKSPYQPEIPFFNAPWILLPLLPFALLPLTVGRAAFFTFSLLVYAVTIFRLGGKPIAVIAIILSYPVIYGLIYGQIDGIISLGFTLPPVIGLFFIIAKPQIGLALIPFWGVMAYKDRGLKGVLKIFFPVTIALLLSFLLFGNWLESSLFPLNQNWNTSLWPQSVPIGLVLLAKSINTKKMGSAMIASPLFSPYLAAHSWSAALLGLVPNTLYVVVCSIGMWLTFILGGGAAAR